MIPLKNQNILINKAKALGAAKAKVIPTKDIVVEERTVLKCIFGCDGWGSRVCPPFVPTVGEFRKMLKGYSSALLVEWGSSNVMSRDVSENFIKYQFVPPEDPKVKEAHRSTARAIIRDRKEIIQPGSLELEKEAWKLGYNTALAMFPGKCMWCASADLTSVNCAGSAGDCRHKTMRRPCMMGVGIRLDKTLSRLGISLPSFPLEGVAPKQYTLILID